VSWTLLIPAALVAVTWLAFETRLLRLGPKMETAAATVLIAGVAATALWVVTAIAAGFVLEFPPVDSLLGWCRIRAAHREVGFVLGMVSLVLSAIMIIRLGCAIRRHRRGLRSGREICEQLGSTTGDMLVADSGRLFAYAVPGRGGGVVVSSAMLDALSDAERHVLLAHERAHLSHRHHHNMVVAELAVAVLPILRPLANRIELATERAADESAALSLSGDRPLVARAIAKAAIASDGASGRPDPTGLSMSGGPVSRRVEAMLEPDLDDSVSKAGVAAAVVLVLVAWAGSVVQLHHMSGLLSHICG